LKADPTHCLVLWQCASRFLSVNTNHLERRRSITSTSTED